MTVMTLGNSEGNWRCDARCHNAEAPSCSCICGGRYHGANLKQGGIQEVVRQFSDELLEAVKGEAATQGVTINVKTFQELFT